MRELFPDCPDKRGRTSEVCKDRICLQECEEDAHYDPTDSCFEECRLCKDELEDHDNNSCRPGCRHCQREDILIAESMGGTYEPHEHVSKALKFVMGSLRETYK